MDSRKTLSASCRSFAFAAVFALFAQTAAADDKQVFGYWKHIDEDTGKTQSIFKLFEYEGKLVGKIVKVYPKPGKQAQKVCSECSGRQKDKPVEGLIFFWDFVHEDGNAKKWTDGKILNPEDGKTYNAEAELSEDGKTLKVFGYIRLLFKVGGTSVWKRPTAEELRGI